MLTCSPPSLNLSCSRGERERGFALASVQRVGKGERWLPSLIWIYTTMTRSGKEGKQWVGDSSSSSARDVTAVTLQEPSFVTFVVVEIRRSSLLYSLTCSTPVFYPLVLNANSRSAGDTGGGQRERMVGGNAVLGCVITSIWNGSQQPRVPLTKKVSHLAGGTRNSDKTGGR